MRTIYIVSEDNHGDLAITLSYQDAINFLLGDRWISEEIANFVLNMSCAEFNEYMEKSEDTFLSISISEIPESRNNIFKIR